MTTNAAPNIIIENSCRDIFFEAFSEMLSRCKAEERAMGLMVIRIQRFREFNITYGYRAGDQLLQETAERIQQVLRNADVLVRLGDHEFGLLLPNIVSNGHAILAANKIHDVMQEPFTLNNRRVVPQINIGIAIFPDHGESAEAILQQADRAVCTARDTHTLYHLTEELSETKEDIPIREMELKEAIEQGDLELYFQPKVNLETGMAKGAEALVRWNHPTRGIVFPDHFITLAEQTGLIVPLTLWTLNAALRQFANFGDKWKDISVAVNLSPAILYDPDVDELITRAIRIWGVSPRNLVLEITENAMMTESLRNMDILQRLHDIGVVISIDDFGTGYSSLAYLQKLPVGELKIDKSFVTNMRNNKDDATIVQSIIDLAHNFGLQVIAEGVEDQETMDLLKSMDCDFAQGYFMAKPLTPDSFQRWLESSTWAPQNTKDLN